MKFSQLSTLLLALSTPAFTSATRDRPENAYQVAADFSTSALSTSPFPLPNVFGRGKCKGKDGMFPLLPNSLANAEI